jgi:hypothetical protein
VMLTFYGFLIRTIVLDSLLTVVRSSRFSNYQYKASTSRMGVIGLTHLHRVPPRCRFTLPPTERVSGLLPEQYEYNGWGLKLTLTSF